MKAKVQLAVGMVGKLKTKIGAFFVLLLIYGLFQNCGTSAPLTTTGASMSTTTPTPTLTPAPAPYALTLYPTSASVAEGGTVTFHASGGSGSYTYSRTSGTGYINSSTGLFTAPYTIETDQISVMDTNGNTAAATVSITYTSSSPTPTGTPGPAPSLLSTGWVPTTLAVWASASNILPNCTINLFTPDWAPSGISGFVNNTQIAQISGGSTNCSSTFVSFTVPHWIVTAFPKGVNYNVSNTDGQWSNPMFVAF